MATTMNSGRIVGGGLVAGLVMNIVDAITNGVALGSEWARQGDLLNAALMTRPALAAMSTGGWVLVDFLLGILVVWTYAAIRPRFGPGVRTALIAGLVIWLATHLFFASYFFNGLYSAGLVAASSAGALVGTLAGACAGGWLYRE